MIGQTSGGRKIVVNRLNEVAPVMIIGVVVAPAYLAADIEAAELCAGRARYHRSRLDGHIRCGSRLTDSNDRSDRDKNSFHGNLQNCSFQ